MVQINQMNNDTDLWEIFNTLSSDSQSLYENDYKHLDSLISNKLNCVNDLMYHQHNFTYSDKFKNDLPKTTSKINDIIGGKLGEGSFPPWFITCLANWLNEDSQKILLNNWLKDDDNLSYDHEWISKRAASDNELYIKVLDKLVKSYKKDKSKQKVSDITNMFMAILPEHLDKASKILSDSTAGVASILLTRTDISEDYIVKGLKALSKLSKQRSVNIKFKFNVLNKLGPKQRLEVMKQVVGLYTKWYQKQPQSLPFIDTPTKEEVKDFLFPCSFKYNTEVTEIVDKFDNIINPPKNNGTPVSKYSSYRY